MPKYTIELTEIRKKQYEINAASESVAEDQVETEYINLDNGLNDSLYISDWDMKVVDEE